MAAKFLNFGQMGAKRITECLFGVGAALSLVSSFILGRFLYMTYTYNKGVSFIQNGQRWFTERPVNNLPLGIIGALASFLVSIIIWKLACEVLYLIIRCMETYMEKNRESID